MLKRVNFEWTRWTGQKVCLAQCFASAVMGVVDGVVKRAFGVQDVERKRVFRLEQGTEKKKGCGRLQWPTLEL